MNQIEKQHLNITCDLDAISYFNTLIQEGYRLSFIDSNQMENLQYQILKLLTDQFNRYTSGQSSSVPVETGQRIQQSIFYTIGYYFKNLPCVESGLEMLKENSLSDLYVNGKKLIEEHRNDAEKLLHTIQNDCLRTDVYAYNSTIQEGLSMFFPAYDIDYGAHESPGSIDYPLSNDKMNLTGVDYLYVYLKKLQMENEFCKCFSNDEIHSLLRGYDREYKELLFNIFDLVLNNIIGSLLLGRNDLELQITDFDRQYLQRELASMSKEDLEKSIDDAVSNLCKMLSVSNFKLKSYMKQSTVNLKSRLKYALENNSLENLFLTLKEETAEQVIQFEDKGKLDNKNFRNLAKEIRECRFVSDKITLLKKEPISITDLIDLLEGDCFFGNEFMDVFQSLEEVQLALLLKKIPLDPFDLSFQLDDNQKEWQSCFNTFLNQIEPSRKATILAMAEHIEIILE